MARSKMVGKAQQRYVMVPVIDPVTGEQKRVGNRGLTVADKTQPLPLRKCDRCGKDLELGKPFRYISIKQQRGGRTLYRCANCPDWQTWEYSSSLSARIQQIQNEDISSDQWTCQEDADQRASEIAEMIRELAEEKEEAASNMEDGFGHETEQSNMIREQADALNEWADQVESPDWPDGAPEDDEDEQCPECRGVGTVPGEDGVPTDCRNCNGEGTLPQDEDPDANLAEWQEEAGEALRSALDDCNVEY